MTRPPALQLHQPGCAPARTHLEEELQLLGLGVLQDLRLQVLEGGHAGVNLIVGAQQHAAAKVVADFRPVQIVPEALSQPVEAHLQGGRTQVTCW